MFRDKGLSPATVWDQEGTSYEISNLHCRGEYRRLVYQGEEE